MANGTFGGGAGTSASPYLIEDALDLNAVRNNTSAHYKMINYINLSSYSSGTGWTPIPSFTGSLDGNGFGITNLYINDTTADNLALFVSLGTNAVVKNLILKVNITGKSYIAGIAARIVGGSVTISGITISGSITATSYMAGITSYSNASSSLVIENCVSSCSLTTATTTAVYGGGIAGYILNGSGRIKNCLYAGVMNGIGTSYAPITPYANSMTSTQNFYDSSITIKTGTFGTNLNTTAAKQSASYVNWELEFYGSESLWIFPLNSYPRLWFDYYPLHLIKVGSVYKKYSSGTWVDVPSIIPTQIEFCKNGFRDIYNVSRTKWMELLSSNPIEILSYNYDLGINDTRDYLVYCEEENNISSSVSISSENEKTFSETNQDRYVYYENDESISLNTDITYENEKTFSETNQDRYVYYENDEQINPESDIIYDVELGSGFGSNFRSVNVPEAKLVRANGDIDLTNVVNIDSFTLTNTTSGSGSIKVIASTDSGTTWKSIDGSLNYSEFIYNESNYTAGVNARTGLTSHFITNPSNSQAWTIEFDVLIPSANAASAYYLFATGSETSSRGVHISYQAGSKSIGFQTPDRRYSLTGVEMPLDIWFNLALTFDGVTLRYYVNGSLKSSTTTFTSSSVSTVGGTITILKPTLAVGFEGQSTIKNLLVISQALTESELRENTGTDGMSVIYLVNKTFTEHKGLIPRIKNPWTSINVTDLTEVKSKAMTATKFNSVTNNEWQKLLLNGTKIRFGYYLEIESSTDSASTDKLALQADINGYFKRANHGTDYDYQFNSPTKLQFSLYADGTYKINYYNS